MREREDNHANGAAPGADPFAPGTVDEAIAARLGPTAHADAEAQLVRTLAHAYALPVDVGAALARVRTRVRTAAATMERPSEARSSISAPAARPQSRAAPTRWRGSGERSGTRLGARWRAVAAGLAAAVVVGSFAAVLWLHASRPGSVATWQDASITAQRTGGRPLGFDPARGVTYAVSDTRAGTIYACGQNHIWYSDDGGRSYDPFTPALPGSAQSSPKGASEPGPPVCSIATVLGAPGLFALIPNPSPDAPSGLAQVVAYAAPGAAGWQLLLPGSATSVASDAAGHVAAIPETFWQPFANNIGGNLVRVVGNWLFVLAAEKDSPPNFPPHLLATPDFGTTWYWLDAPIEQQGLYCAGVAVDPTNPQHLYCVVALPGSPAGSAPSASQGRDIFETRDGGRSWQSTGIIGDAAQGQGDTGRGLAPAIPLSLVYTLPPDAVSAAAIYAQTTVNRLLRRPLTGGHWRLAATLPNGAALAGIAPDDGVYAATSQPTGSSTSVQAYALAPETQRFMPAGQRGELPFGRATPVYALGGDGSGGQRALYAHAAAQPSAQPLDRLDLETLGPGPTVDSTPLPTPAATPSPLPTATTSPACAAAPGDLSAIQPGGLGATIATFPPRWGAMGGPGLAGTYYGTYADTGTPRMLVVTPASNGRVAAMEYLVDSTRQVTLAQAQAIVQSILPQDAVRQPGLGSPNAMTLTQTYCSPTYAAAFPPGTSGLPRGLLISPYIQVEYHLRGPAADAYTPVDRIGIQMFD